MAGEEATGEARVFRAPADILAGAPKVGTDVIHIDEWDTDVRVQGITKRQHSKITSEATNADTGEVDTDVIEMAMFRDGVVEPKFTEEQIEELWRDGAPGPINRVLMRILELSGRKPGDGVKTAVKTFPPADGEAV